MTTDGGSDSKWKFGEFAIMLVLAGRRTHRHGAFGAGVVAPKFAQTHLKYGNKRSDARLDLSGNSP